MLAPSKDQSDHSNQFMHKIVKGTGNNEFDPVFKSIENDNNSQFLKEDSLLKKMFNNGAFDDMSIT